MLPTTEPVELWAELTKYPRPHKIVDFPRKKPGTQEPICQLAMVVLTQSESMAANAQAEKTARRLLKDAAPQKGETSRGYDELFQSAACSEVLVRACKKADDPELKKPLFRSVDDVQQYMTPDEVAVLMTAYLVHKAETGPVMSAFDSEEELDGWLRAIFIGGNYSPLFSASSALQIQCTTYLGSRWYALPTGSFSAGSSQDLLESSTDSAPSTSD